MSGLMKRHRQGAPLIEVSFLRRLGLTALIALAFQPVNRVFGLSTEATQSMIIIEGDHGRGSGFLVQMDGKTYVVTNSHVIQGNKNLRFKDLSNQELTTGPLQIADQADLVRAEVTGANLPLQLAPRVEQAVRIGTKIAVAGNSEGKGVVRELEGKVVGIGPDRIEVDAQFVPGNSGSPILVATTGQVIGVATYMIIPTSPKTAAIKKKGSAPNKTETSPTSLNEVRRFGYRLDTVGSWISPSSPDRLVQEGMKLEQLDDTLNLVIALLYGRIEDVARGSGPYISKERLAANPGLASIATAIDEYAARSRAGKQAIKGKLTTSAKQNSTKLIESLRTATINDVRMFKAENFSGYFAVLFKEHLERRKDLYEWFDELLPGGTKTAVLAGLGTQSVDYSKLNFKLSDEFNPAAAPEKRHQVSYPPGSRPASLENIFWVLRKPDNAIAVSPMRGNNYDVPAVANGTYRLSVEYRASGTTRPVSNVLEIKVEGLEVPSKSATTVATPMSSSSEIAVVVLAGPKFRFEEGAKAYTNQKYPVTNAPEALVGLKFLQNRGGFSVARKIEVKSKGILYVAYAVEGIATSKISPADDQAALAKLGFQKTDLGFNINNLVLKVYSKVVEESFTLPSSNAYSGLVIIGNLE